jgi:hypothetical protein
MHHDRPQDYKAYDGLYRVDSVMVRGVHWRMRRWTEVFVFGSCSCLDSKERRSNAHWAKVSGKECFTPTSNVGHEGPKDQYRRYPTEQQDENKTSKQLTWIECPIPCVLVPWYSSSEVDKYARIEKQVRNTGQLHILRLL